MSFHETFLRNRQLKRAQRAGAKWLDAHAPGWWNGPAALKIADTERQLNHIEVPLLDLSSGALCVLGQLWGEPDDPSMSGYGTMRHHIQRREPFDTFDLGFVADEGYEVLTRYWRRDIRRRRKRAAASAG